MFDSPTRTDEIVALHALSKALRQFQNDPLLEQLPELRGMHSFAALTLAWDKACEAISPDLWKSLIRSQYDTQRIEELERIARANLKFEVRTTREGAEYVFNTYPLAGAQRGYHCHGDLRRAFDTLVRGYALLYPEVMRPWAYAETEHRDRRAGS